MGPEISRKNTLSHGVPRASVIISGAAKIPTPPGAGGQSPPVPDIPAGAMVTCSADNTVRVWDLGALDGKGTGDNENRHSGRQVDQQTVTIIRHTPFWGQVESGKLSRHVFRNLNFYHNAVFIME